MKSKLTHLLVAGLGCSILCGCSIGMQPTGSSVEEINEIRSHWTPEKQIEGIQHSPMRPAEKKKRIAEIRAKYHMPYEDSPVNTAKATAR